MGQVGSPCDYQPDAVGPLAGIRVLDLSRLVAGNVVSHVLADFGAEVVKVEAPGRGDDLRAWKVADVATYWKVYARNKKSITLDLRHEEGRELLLRLAGSADLLIENFVPGRLEKMGLAPERLHEANPRLVIVRVSGWGQTGPFSHKPGFGTLVEAMSGFAAMNGFPDRAPVLPPLALADMISGVYGASAAMIALRHVEVSGGKGQVVDLSLFEPMLSVLGPEAANYQLSGEPTPRRGSRASNTAPRNVYPCRDGKFVALSASMQSVAGRLFRVMGREDLISDPRFRTNSDRVRNNDAIDAIVAEFMAERSQADNLALFEAAGVTVGPVSDAADLAEHPYVLGRKILPSFPDPDMGRLPMHNVTPRLSGTPGAIRAPAPELGQHNEEIYADLGLGGADLDRLRAAGTI
ncbi:CaiB/BaiF CoA transferase family protein [Enterovirga sp. CN4-39]|uniref:CaiB/BaiF CoA transferase family protein n=1 Tax=Enterovirga sp. CN4-39 TaxID=3400910 RepID=UPI003C0EB283